MLFNSYSFIVFLAVVILLHYLRFSWKVKKINLLMASYLFYAAWNPPFILLLWLSTVVDFYAARMIDVAQNPARRKLLLGLSLLVNLGMLGFFKYGNFILENFMAITSALGFDYHPAAPDIILPVGISFYTFQTLSYTLDVYYKKLRAERSLLDFSLFVTFFPQLVAGPIVRPSVLIPQFKAPKQAQMHQMIKGALLLSLGLFMKIFLADTMLSGSADTVFGSQAILHPLDAWLGVLAFSGQIFFDFAGYSTCAIGIAAILGFSLPDNFRFPYAATSFSDFWKRWHITLSTWLRDYLYIPLGGNRKSKTRTYINLMLTMLIGGLWHGASWTFIVWGGLHGTYLVVERFLNQKNIRTSIITDLPDSMPVRASFVPDIIQRKPVMLFMKAIFVFFLVNIAWVFFRAADFSTSWRLLGSMFGLNEDGIAVLPTIDIIKISVITSLTLIIQWLMRNTSVLETTMKLKWWVLGLIWSLMVFLIVLSQKSSDSFIYFQF